MSTKPVIKVWDPNHEGRIDYIMTNSYNALVQKGLSNAAEEMCGRLFKEMLYISYAPVGKISKTQLRRWIRAVVIIGDYVELDWAL